MSSDNNVSRKNHNDNSLEFATCHKLPWDSSETNYLETHLQDPTFETAVELGRTYEAVQSKRADLKLRKVIIYNMTGNKNNQKPMTLNEAVDEQDKQRNDGASCPTIMSIPGGYVVVESYIIGRR